MLRRVVKRFLQVLFLVFFIWFAYNVALSIYYVFDSKTPDVSIAGHYDPADGIGTHAVNLVNNINPLNLDINLVTSFRPLDVWKAYKKGYNKIISQLHKPWGHVLVYEFPVTIPEGINRFLKIYYANNTCFLTLASKVSKAFRLHSVNLDLKPDIAIAYSVFETSKIYNKSAELLNKYFDMVVVPDVNIVDSYISAGVYKPIFVLPLDIDYQDILSSPLKNSRNEVFTFVNLAMIHPRKNQLKLVQAFAELYANNPKYRLIINGRGGSQVAKQLNQYIASKAINNITVTKKKLPRDQYLALLKQADVAVYIAVGEGFSIQPREAMAMGIPTIISDDHLAQKSIADSGLVEVVPGKNKINASQFFNFFDKIENPDVGYVYDIEIEDLKNAMLKVDQNYKQYLAKSEATRKWASQYVLYARQQEYQNMVMPKQVVFGSENKITKDFLMTNSWELYNKYKDIVNNQVQKSYTKSQIKSDK